MLDDTEVVAIVGPAAPRRLPAEPPGATAVQAARDGRTDT